MAWNTIIPTLMFPVAGPSQRTEIYSLSKTINWDKIALFFNKVVSSLCLHLDNLFDSFLNKSNTHTISLQISLENSEKKVKNLLKIWDWVLNCNVKILNKDFYVS